MSSSSKSFTAKYSFPIGIIVTCLFLVAAGFLESTIEALFSFHSSNPKLSFFIWTDLFLTALVIVFYGDLKKFVKKDRVIFRSLRSLASLRFTVFLFSFSLFLVFVGTIGQTEKGIWEAVNDYFRCFVGRVPLSIFFKGDSSEALRNLHFFFPGGYLIGIFLLVNLLTAHTLKFKLNATKKNIIWGSAVTLVGLGLLGMVIYNGIVREDIPSAYIDSYTRVLYRLLNGLGVSLVILTGCWGLFKKRAGIVLLHFGVILLLFSELVTGIFATEGNMRIAEGASSSFVSLSRRYELAISLADENSAGEKSVVVPWNLLKDNNEWQSHKSLPFSFRVNKWLINSSVEERKVAANEKFKGLASRYRLEANKEVSGVDGADINVPAMEIEIRDNAGKSLGHYIFSVLFSMQDKPMHDKVTADGKTYKVILRNQREYLYSRKAKQPLRIELIDFRFDKYIGTREAQNYSSLIRLVDKEKGVDRKILISMNNPLRYSGRTFYQSSFAPDESGTVLQVVQNPGWMIPYMCCMIVGVGMMFQFLLTLIKSIKRQS